MCFPEGGSRSAEQLAEGVPVLCGVRLGGSEAMSAQH